MDFNLMIFPPKQQNMLALLKIDEKVYWVSFNASYHRNVQEACLEGQGGMGGGEMVIKLLCIVERALLP